MVQITKNQRLTDEIYETEAGEAILFTYEMESGSQRREANLTFLLNDVMVKSGFAQLPKEMDRALSIDMHDVIKWQTALLLKELAATGGPDRNPMKVKKFRSN